MRAHLLLLLIASLCLSACTRQVTDTRVEVSASASPAPELEGRAEPLALNLEGSPTLGPHVARVTLIVSTDFECPFCSKLAPTLKALSDRYPQSLRIVFKNNPLGFHERALPAAKAALAASLQGKFWPYHDRLFAEQSALDDADLERHARALGLHMGKWREAKESALVHDKIMHDKASMMGQGAMGTPTCFINGKQLPGARPLEMLVDEVESALAEADALLAEGTPLKDVHRVLAARHAGESFVESVIGGGTPPEPPPPEPRADRPPPPPELVDIAPHPEDPSIGPADAPVVLIEFADFECPFCKRNAADMAALRERYPDKVRVVFKHLPLAFHQRAHPAAMASLAAHAQGKFWPYHDLLFDNPRALSDKDLLRYAKEVGLDLKAFKRFIKEGAGEPHLARDYDLAESTQTRATPTTFVNGFRVPGAVGIERFKALIEAALNSGP